MDFDKDFILENERVILRPLEKADFGFQDRWNKKRFDSIKYFARRLEKGYKNSIEKQD